MTTTREEARELTDGFAEYTAAIADACSSATADFRQLRDRVAAGEIGPEEAMVQASRRFVELHGQSLQLPDRLREAIERENPQPRSEG